MYSRRRAGYLVAAAAIALVPLIFRDAYWRTNLTVCAINVMLVIGLDFILGYAGQLNLGHSAFYGIGAYASTLRITRLGVPFWMAFVCAIALAGAAGMALACSPFACAGTTSRSPRSLSPSLCTRFCSTGSA